MTTRSRRYEDLAAVVDLDVLTPEDALALLTRHRPARNDQEQTDAAELVAELGYHALAVDVAGAALRTQIDLLSYAEFRTALQDPSQDELELAAELAGALPGGHEASIATTLQRSIRRLGPEGSDVLRLAAVVAAAPLPLALIAAVLKEADGLDEQAARRRATRGVNQAETLSLASQTGSSTDPDTAGEPTVEGGWMVHALVARTMRVTDPDQQRTATLRAGAVTVLTQALKAIVDPSAHTSLRQVVPHARELARHQETAAEIELLGWVARYDYQRGDYRSAEQAERQVMEAYRRVLGDDHPNTLTSIGNLAETRRGLGDPDGARQLHEQVLDISRRVLGPEHPNTLRSMNNLAGTLYQLGDLIGARDMYREVLDASRRVLRPEHPHILGSISNLAETLRALGEAAAARDLLQQVLDVRRRLLGPKHPDTLRTMNNLAGSMYDLGDAAGARDLHRQVLDARRRLLGPEHPDTLLSMSNLADTLRDLGDVAGARDLLQQALNGYRRVLGPEHPATRSVAEKLARM